MKLQLGSLEGRTEPSSIHGWLQPEDNQPWAVEETGSLVRGKVLGGLTVHGEQISKYTTYFVQRKRNCLTSGQRPYGTPSVTKIGKLGSWRNIICRLVLPHPLACPEFLGHALDINIHRCTVCLTRHSFLRVPFFFEVWQRPGPSQHVLSQSVSEVSYFHCRQVTCTIMLTGFITIQHDHLHKTYRSWNLPPSVAFSLSTPHSPLLLTFKEIGWHSNKSSFTPPSLSNSQAAWNLTCLYTEQHSESTSSNHSNRGNTIGRGPIPEEANAIGDRRRSTDKNTPAQLVKFPSGLEPKLAYGTAFGVN